MIDMRDADAATALLVSDLRGIFGPRLRAVVVYGEYDGRSPEGASDPDAPLHTFVGVDSLTFENLGRCASNADRWAGKGLAAPLIMTLLAAACSHTNTIDGDVLAG